MLLVTREHEPARRSQFRRMATRSRSPLFAALLGAFALSGGISFVPLLVRCKTTSASSGAAIEARIGRVARAQEGTETAELQVDDTVEAVYPDDGEWYAGTIEKDNGDGTFQVRWEDPDGGPETSACKASDIKKIVPRTPLDQLELGAKVKGVVRNVREFGAFVDIGAERDGLVHVSKLPSPEAKTGPFANGDTVEALYPDDSEWYPATVEKDNGDGTFEVKWDDPDGGPETSNCKSEDMKHYAQGLQTDDEVEVWVERVTDDGKLQLTMVPPPDLSVFRGLHPDEWLDGKVVSIAKFGLFVNVNPPGGGSPQRGLVHISQITEGFVEDPWAQAEEGQEVKVRVVDVDEDLGKLSLSMVSGHS